MAPPINTVLKEFSPFEVAAAGTGALIKMRLWVIKYYFLPCTWDSIGFDF